MFDLLVAILNFSSAFLLHVLLHRIIKKRNQPTISTAFTYFVILPFLIIELWFLSDLIKIPVVIAVVNLKLTALLLYCLMSCLMVILYSPLLLKGVVPAGTILAAFAKKNTLNWSEIMRLFNEEDLLKPRLESLLSTNLITKHKKTYSLTKFGKAIYLLVHLVEITLGIPIGG